MQGGGGPVASTTPSSICRCFSASTVRSNSSSGLHIHHPPPPLPQRAPCANQHRARRRKLIFICFGVGGGGYRCLMAASAAYCMQARSTAGSFLSDPAAAACQAMQSETPSPRAFIFSVENAVCKDSYRCKCRRNRLLRSLPTLTSVRILTDSVLSIEEKNARGLPVSDPRGARPSGACLGARLSVLGLECARWNHRGIGNGPLRSPVPRPAPSHWRDCHFDGTPLPTHFDYLLKVEGGAAERQSRRRLPAPAPPWSAGPSARRPPPPRLPASSTPAPAGPAAYAPPVTDTERPGPLRKTATQRCLGRRSKTGRECRQAGCSSPALRSPCSANCSSWPVAAATTRSNEPAEVPPGPPCRLS